MIQNIVIPLIISVPDPSTPKSKSICFNIVKATIKWTIANGYDYLDLGGTFSLDTNDGLYRFKQAFCYPDKYSNFIGELDVVYDREKYERFLITK